MYSSQNIKIKNSYISKAHGKDEERGLCCIQCSSFMENFEWSEWNAILNGWWRLICNLLWVVPLFPLLMISHGMGELSSTRRVSLQTIIAPLCLTLSSGTHCWVHSCWRTLSVCRWTFTNNNWLRKINFLHLHPCSSNHRLSDVRPWVFSRRKTFSFKNSITN